MSQVKFYATSGIVQHHTSITAFVAEYNQHGNVYETRKSESGADQLWHKGHNMCVGYFVAPVDITAISALAEEEIVRTLEEAEGDAEQAAEWGAKHDADAAR